MPNPHDPPFELPLQIDDGRPFVVCDARYKTVAAVYGVVDVAQARTRKIRDCVNAHDKLVVFVREYRQVCDIERRKAEENGLDVVASSWADDIREIDDALAEQPCEAEKLAVCLPEIAADAGIELIDD